MMTFKILVKVHHFWDSIDNYQSAFEQLKTWIPRLSFNMNRYMLYKNCRMPDLAS